MVVFVVSLVLSFVGAGDGGIDEFPPHEFVLLHVAPPPFHRFSCKRVYNFSYEQVHNFFCKRIYKFSCECVLASYCIVLLNCLNLLFEFTELVLVLV